MSGRRFLDAAALLKASRDVLAKHLVLRQKQYDNFNKTSSVSKAVKSQTDRVRLTAKAASVLAERFNGPGPAYTTQASQSAWVAKNVKNENGDSLASETGIQKEECDGERSGKSPIKEQSLNHEAQVKQGTTRSYLRLENDERSTKSKTSRANSVETQLRASTGQPRGEGDKAKDASSFQQADSPLTATSEAATGEAATGAASELRVDQEPDTFSPPIPSKDKITSALPIVKLPRNTETTQESNKHVPDDQINQDVFYSSKPEYQGLSSDNRAMREQGELPEAAYSGIFQSRKVSKMLRGQPPRQNSVDGLDLPGTKETITQVSKAAEESDMVNSSVRIPRQSAPNSSPLSANSKAKALAPRGNESAGELAADLAKDANSIAAASVTPSVNLADASKQPPYEMRESKVPSSRFSRMWQYGGLATSMAFGAVGESFRRATGSTPEAGGSLMLSEANMQRLVSKLSKMRGAALKLGQMMSFQDSKMLPKPIHDVLQRVQDSADYMPASQRNRVLSSNLGSEWRALFSHFEETPIAAASIGQVHRAILASTSQSVAVKIQYPGVASSIDSDLSNLAILLTASRLLPKGLYLDKTIANARVELAWECDYLREAEMATRFRNLLADETNIYHVPAIIKEASAQQVLTAEFAEGTGVTKGQHFTQEQKDWIGINVLRLCLREITEFKFMQTDPNWTNFLFNDKAHKLELLDFGASRDFPDRFILPYIRTLLAASRGDREQVRDLSVELGYLTGHESQAMVKAHVSSVLTLAEPFAETAPEVYDFRNQTITDRVRGYIPVMLRERLAPPPEETYSIHRKLSGAFLLCAKLGSRVRCREMFEESMRKAGMF